MTVKAEVAFRGKDETASALRSIVRNTEAAQKNITSKLRSALAFLGTGAALHTFTRGIADAIRSGDDLAKFAAKTKLTAEAASEFAHVAKMSDTDIGAFSLGIKTMQTRISEAASGSKSAVALFKSLGIELEYLQSLSTDQRFELIAEQISRLVDVEDQARARTEAFGRAGEALAPAMERGAAGIRELREQAQLVFSEEDLQRIQEADTAFKNLSQSWAALKGQLAISAGPSLGGAADALRKMLGGRTQADDLRELELAAAAQKRILESFGDDRGTGYTAAAERYASTLERLAQLKIDLAVERAPGVVPGEAPPGFSWLKDVETQAKLTKKELEELERFNNQSITMRNDAARLQGSIAPDISENDAALRTYFAGVMDDNLPQTSRVIELGEAFKESQEKADSLMETLRDESARESFEALSDAVAGFGDGADKAGDRILKALQRVLANKITTEFIELMMGLGGGGQGGFLGAVGKGFSWLFGGTMGRAHGGSVFAGEPTWVGEKGRPELFTPSQSGTITPAHRVGGGDSITLAPSYHIQIDARSDAAAIHEHIVAVTTEGNRKMMEELHRQRSIGRR